MTIFTANPRVKCDLQHNIAHIVAAKGGIGQVPATSGYQGQKFFKLGLSWHSLA